MPIVDLPLPLSPISETTSPGATCEADVVDGAQARRRRTCRPGRPSSTRRARASGRRPPARDLVARLDLDERRLLRSHFANASGQRSRKRQPAGGSSSDGGRPGIPASRFSAKRTPTSGSDESSSRVYGCRGALTIVSAGAFSASLPGVHDEDRVGDLVEDGEVVGDHDHALHEAAVAELDEQLAPRRAGSTRRAPR